VRTSRKTKNAQRRTLDAELRTLYFRRLGVGRWTLGVFCLSFAIACAVRAQTYQGRELVKAELRAETSEVVPGKSFTVGLLLRMAPNWHTYWKFSGDAGLPTEINWNLPAGWNVGEIQWPIPHKTVDPGDIQTYGYQDEVMLMQQITPPDKIDGSTVKLSASVDWLVCEKICIPGSAKLELDLPVSTTSAPENTELFARYRKQLPGLVARDLFIRGFSWGANQASFTLSSSTFRDYAFADFYPLPDEKTVVGHPTAEIRGDEVTVRIPTETKLPNDPPVIESPPPSLKSPDKIGIPGLVVIAQSATDQNRAGFYIGKIMMTKPAAVATPAPAPQIAATRSILTFLLFGFIGGFILNLMPCVLPVISLKIFGFIQQAGKDRRSILRNGLWFVTGIFVWFVGLALLLIILKVAGHQPTWAAQFTNPYFVLGLSVIVLVFALDLFGVFEITLPQTVMHRVLRSTEREGEAGSFFQGLFATILATPCTAPFLGTAVGFAFTQSALIIFAMFVAIAAGMSAPYLALSAQPAWLRFLPKPGPWMLRVKQFMGFLLLATLLFLLYVLGAQRGVEGAIWASAFLLVIAIACWLKGAFVVPMISAGKRVFVVVLMVVLVVASGSYFIGDKFRNSTIENFTAKTNGDWQPFTPERLKSELAQDHPVFIDFTAAWCITCKFNEKAVLENAAVRDAFQRHGVVRLRADWTNGDPEITKLLQQFGRPGVPLYVLYRGQAGQPFVFPELLTKNIVLEKLETIPASVASR
jgi:thiol:disulfide interchange protein/DsbC/DsbD-like thiol-disulfide interchange protein